MCAFMCNAHVIVATPRLHRQSSHLPPCEPTKKKWTPWFPPRSGHERRIRSYESILIFLMLSWDTPLVQLPSSETTCITFRSFMSFIRKRKTNPYWAVDLPALCRLHLTHWNNTIFCCNTATSPFRLTWKLCAPAYQALAYMESLSAAFALADWWTDCFLRLACFGRVVASYAPVAEAATKYCPADLTRKIYHIPVPNAISLKLLNTKFSFESGILSDSNLPLWDRRIAPSLHREDQSTEAWKRQILISL